MIRGVMFVIMVAMATGVLGQAPPTLANTGFDPNCRDNLDNCELFGLDKYCSGDYIQWATDNCAASCKICNAPPTQPPPCVDVLGDCDAYPKEVCSNDTYIHWAQDNCRRFCRFCPQSVLDELDKITTTLSPEQCVETMDCRVYPKSVCTDPTYVHWAKENCPLYCGMCPGITTAPKPCVDHVPCEMYAPDLCTNPDYKLWAEDNCAKHCGVCGGGGPPAPAVTALPTPAPGGPALANTPPPPAIP